MDELELLKSRWRNQDSGLPQLSYNEIYKMLLKKSSSIVKWILFISIGEIILWTGLSFMVPESSKKFSYEIGLQDFLNISQLLYYVVFACFVIVFYKNYQKISATDSVKQLMANILRTRGTVKYFIIYNLLSAGIMLIGVNIFYYFNQDEIFHVMVKEHGVLASMGKTQFFQTFFIVQAVIALVTIILIFLFYRFIYGTLLKKLKKNYNELKRMEH